MPDIIDFNDTLFVFTHNILNEIIIIPISIVFKLTILSLFQTVDDVT
jgi:hypothetical protein